MATTVRTFTPVLGKRFRMTALDNCGRIPEPAAEDVVAVSDGFISVTLSAEVEEGTEIVVKKADGSLCVNERLASSFKNFTLEMEFCGVNPGVLSLSTNAEMYENYESIASGIVVPEGLIDKRFAFELWTGLSGQACAEDVEEASGYMLLPYVHAGIINGLTVDGENSVSFNLANAYTRGGNGWGRGPYNVLNNGGSSDVLPTALDPLDHFLLVETGIAPPPVANGLSDMIAYTTTTTTTA